MPRTCSGLAPFVILFAGALVAPVLRGQDSDSADAKPAVAMAGIISAYAGEGLDKVGYTGDGGPAIDARVGEPNGVWLDKSGNVYFSDYYTESIRVVNAETGVITRIAGRGKCESAFFDCGDGGSALDAQIYSPWGGVVDSEEKNLYFADRSNDEVRRIDLASGIITQVAGTTCPGASEFGCGPKEGFMGDGGPAADALLEFPMAVALDSEGNLYIADSGNNAIRKVTMSTGKIETVAGRGNGCAHQLDDIGDGCTATEAALRSPNGVAFDKAGNLFISELEFVRRVDARTGIVTLYAGSIAFNSSCPNQQDRDGDGCPANAITMMPTAIAFDPEGNLNVMDELAPYGGYVRRIDKNTGLLSRIAGGGDCAPVDSYYCGNGKPATAAELGYPNGIAFDRNGNLYTADFHGGAVSKVTFDTSKFAQTPSFTPPPGVYQGAQRVRLADATSGAKIYYTLDGSMPTTSSREYIGPIALTENTTINAIAAGPGALGESALATGSYAIQLPPAVTTEPATSVETYSVSLHATINDDDQSTKFWFVYGTSRTDLSISTSKSTLPALISPRSESWYLAGLKPKTTYYFKAIASNTSGTALGDVLSFTTQ